MEYSLCHMKFEDDYRLDMDAIKAMVTDKTKVLSICHPNNPTGCTLTEPELHEIVDFCREKDIYLLSDETYREMCVARTACCLACPATRLCLRWKLQQDACSRSAAPVVFAPGEQRYATTDWTCLYAAGTSRTRRRLPALCTTRRSRSPPCPSATESRAAASAGSRARISTCVRLPYTRLRATGRQLGHTTSRLSWLRLTWVVYRTDHHARAVSLPRSCWTRF
jgi:hypothetical protein